MDRFEAMRTLVAAVDGGSLSAASRALRLPLPTVSRRVSDLERQLGTGLVVRTSRRLLLTEAGSAYVASARRILDDLDEAERAAAGEYRAPRGNLAVTAPVMFGRLHVQPVVLEFLRQFAEVSVRLGLSDQYLDLVENRIDAAVRIGPLPDSSLVAQRLGAVRWITCASPRYLAARGAPASPAELAGHDCIAFERVDGPVIWHFADGATEPLRPRFVVNTAAAALDAAIADAGILRVLSYQAARDIVAGRLVPVLPDFVPEPLPVHVVHAPQPLLPRKLRTFLEFAVPRLRATLSAVPGT